MRDAIPSLDRLIHELSRLPGIGPKTAQRLAYFILRSPQSYIEALRLALHDVKTRVHECPSCFSYTEGDGPCVFCRDSRRSDEVICVVESPSDIMRIDAAGVFRGRYHVLHGAISPLEGISPNDLKIEPLVQKIIAGIEGRGPRIREIIMALDADIEGDTTVLYLAKRLEGKEIKISRIAHGVPIGGNIDYIDDRTLGRALENRVPV